MKKKPLPIEFILLAISFVITAIAVLFVFKPPAKDYVKLIKWSPESTTQGVMENSARRMFPILSESRQFLVDNLESINLKSTDLKNIFQDITKLSFTISSDSSSDSFNMINYTINHSSNILIPGAELKETNHDPSQLNPTAKKVILKINFSQIELSQINTTNFFDSLNLEKLLKKFKANKFQDKNIIFALYQTGKYEYTLTILKIR